MAGLRLGSGRAQDGLRTVSAWAESSSMYKIYVSDFKNSKDGLLVGFEKAIQVLYSKLLEPLHKKGQLSNSIS